MKKLNFLLLSAVALGITTTSCTKHEDAAPSIVAKWYFDSRTHTGNGITSPEEAVNDSSCPEKNFLDLKATGDLQEQAVGDKTDPCSVNKVDGKYTYQNNVLKITESASSTDLTALSVTDTKLKFKLVNPDDPTDYYTYNLTK